MTGKKYTGLGALQMSTSFMYPWPGRGLVLHPSTQVSVMVDNSQVPDTVFSHLNPTHTTTKLMRKMQVSLAQ